MRKLFLVLPIIIASISLSACGFSLAQDITPPPGYTQPAPLPTTEAQADFPLLPPDPAAGEAIYIENCANCHGNSGIGNGPKANGISQPPSSLLNPDLVFIRSPYEWYQITTNGIPGSPMPGFKSELDDRSRWNVTAYLYMMNAPADQLSLGKQIFDSTCIDCHGEKGKGDGIGAKNLPLQPPDFTNQSILPPRSDMELFGIVANGSSNVMPAFVNTFTEEERRAVIFYLRALSFAGVDVQEIETASEQETQSATSATAPAADTTPSPEDAATITKVTIQGSIINDSGNTVPTGTPVTLHIYDEMNETGTLQTGSLLDGSFVFNNVDMAAGRIFIASVSYNGMEFNSQPSFHPDQAAIEGEDTTTDNINLPIHVYDSTSDTSTLIADRMHIFFDFSVPGTMQVVELFLVSNTGPNVVVPENAGVGVLNFELPANAENLQFQDSTLGERYLPIDNGFSDTASIPPGEAVHQVLYAYNLPYSKKATLTIPVPMDTRSVSVMAPVDGIKMKSDVLVDGGIRTNQGVSFNLYNGSDFKKGDSLNLQISGSVSTPNDQPARSINPVLFGAGLLLLVLTGIGYYYFYTLKSNQPQRKAESQVSAEDKETLMDAIIALDELHKAGKLTDAIYQERRTALKERLKKVL